MGQQFLSCRWPLTGEQPGILRQCVALKIMNPKVNLRTKGATGDLKPACSLGRLEEGSRKLLRLVQPGKELEGQVQLSLGQSLAGSLAVPVEAAQRTNGG